jgi:hypothetical protein
VRKQKCKLSKFAQQTEAQRGAACHMEPTVLIPIDTYPQSTSIQSQPQQPTQTYDAQSLSLQQEPPHEQQEVHKEQPYQTQDETQEYHNQRELHNENEELDESEDEEIGKSDSDSDDAGPTEEDIVEVDKPKRDRIRMLSATSVINI